MVRVWDCSPNGSGVTKGEYAIISGRINDLAWDGDSQRIIAVGDGKQRYGHCITADSGNSVGEITGHSAQVNAVSIRQQRPLRAATGGDDKNLVFYHGPPFKFNGIPGRGQHSNFIYGVAFSPDGSHLVSVGADKKILLYDGKTGDIKQEISDGSDGHKGSIFGISWSADSKEIVTCSADRAVKTWDVEMTKVKHTWSFGESMAVSDQQVGVVWPKRSDGLIISLSLSGELNYLNTRSPNPFKVISGHQKSITALTTTTESTSDVTLWTGSYDGRLRAWNSSTGVADAIEGEGHTNIISGLAATKGSHPRLYSVGWDDSLRAVDTGAKTYVGGSTRLSSQPKALTCTSDSLVVVAQVESVIVFSGSEELGELPLKSPPSSLAATSSTGLVAIGGEDSSLLFTVPTNKAPKQVGIVEKVSIHPITALAFSQDGTLIAAGTSTGKIYVYKLSSGVTGLVTGTYSVELVTDRWSGAHTGKITCLAWNEAGTHAVSGSLDTNIFVWSLANPGARIKATNAHKEGVSGIAWVGEEVISTGADATIKKWKVQGLK